MIRARLAFGLVDLLVEPKVELADVADQQIDDSPDRRRIRVHPAVVGRLRPVEDVVDPLLRAAAEQRIRIPPGSAQRTDSITGARERLLLALEGVPPHGSLLG